MSYPLLTPDWGAAKVSSVPVFEEAPEPKSHQFERGLDHKGGGEEVVAVFQRRLQRLSKKETKGEERKEKKGTAAFTVSEAL